MRLTARDKALLAQSLGCRPDELAARLRQVEAAAREEYLAMILGQRNFTRGQDIREWRLVLIAHHLFDGRLPSERFVSAVFQTSPAQSRGLLRAVLAKYQYELQDGIRATLAATVAGAQLIRGTTTWTIVPESENVVDALNLEIQAIDPALPQISRRRATVGTYEVTQAAMNALRGRFAP
jgi:hypothetical protein